MYAYRMRSPHARYRFAGSAGWRDCRVIDVMPNGATLELYDVTPDDMLSAAVYVSMAPIVGDEEVILLRAWLNDAACHAVGVTTAKIEYPTLSNDQYSLLRLLVRLHDIS
jgi:hypothetical protein